MQDLNIEHLRRFAIARSLFAPTTLPRAIDKLGFVQADPIRSPARAQDLILRHRVKDYRAGDLEQRYAKLTVEEDFFVNYGFMPRELADLMHPRVARRQLSALQRKQGEAIIEFVRERGQVHPKEVDAHFQHGASRNWFGGNSRVSTQLLDALHYRGELRTARRENGIRTYALRTPAPHGVSDHEAIDRLIDVFVALYAPLPAKSLTYLLGLLMRGVPQWRTQRSAALLRAKARLGNAQIEGIAWYWSADENPQAKRYAAVDESARFLAPFDPVVWDRTRFELLWKWSYRFEAYTPAPKRKMGYYAMPLLLGDQVIGWGNIDATGEQIQVEVGLKHKFTQAVVKRALEQELVQLSQFLSKPINKLRWI